MTSVQDNFLSDSNNIKWHILNLNAIAGGCESNMILYCVCLCIALTVEGKSNLHEVLFVIAELTYKVTKYLRDYQLL